MIINRLSEQAKKFIRDNHNELKPTTMAEIVGASKSTVYVHMRRNKISVHKEKKQSVLYLKEPENRVA